jgi:transposase-like protein
MKKYDKECKKEAVMKYLDGHSMASISREIGVNENTIYTAAGKKRFCR